MDKLSLYTNGNFEGLRKRTDSIADQAVETLIQHPYLLENLNLWDEIPRNLPAELPLELRSFLKFYLEIEGRAPEKLLKSGQNFFSRKGDLYLAMLGFYSLPYCYAFADGAEVLIRSNRIVNQIGERLGETGSFLLSLFEPGAFTSSRSAYWVCAKVRLIHAFSRYYILTYARDWKAEYGSPINQEDLIGTNLAFSLMVLRGLRKVGESPSSEETDTILKYWAWVGELMGVDIDFWPTNGKEAFELERLIRKRHLKNSEAGEKLIRALIKFYEESIPDPLLSKQAESIVSFFVGDEASKALGLSQDLRIPGDLLGLVFRFSGFQAYGSKKSFSAIQKQFELNQIEQFGKVLKVNLPLLKRS